MTTPPASSLGPAPPEVAIRAGAVVVTFKCPGGTPGKTPGKTLGKTPGKTPDLILQLLAQTPELSIPEIARRLDKSVSAIERAIRKLQQTGRLTRIGPAKGGRWQVIDD